MKGKDRRDCDIAASRQYAATPSHPAPPTRSVHPHPHHSFAPIRAEGSAVRIVIDSNRAPQDCGGLHRYRTGGGRHAERCFQRGADHCGCGFRRHLLQCRLLHRRRQGLRAVAQKRAVHRVAVLLHHLTLRTGTLGGLSPRPSETVPHRIPAAELGDRLLRQRLRHDLRLPDDRQRLRDQHLGGA